MRISATSKNDREGENARTPLSHCLHTSSPFLIHYSLLLGMTRRVTAAFRRTNGWIDHTKDNRCVLSLCLRASGSLFILRALPTHNSEHHTIRPSFSRICVSRARHDLMFSTVVVALALVRPKSPGEAVRGHTSLDQHVRTSRVPMAE